MNTFSSFDGGNKPSEQTEPERFYHGFVLGMVVNMADMYIVRSNRERGQYEPCSYGRYDNFVPQNAIHSYDNRFLKARGLWEHGMHLSGN